MLISIVATSLTIACVWMYSRAHARGGENLDAVGDLHGLAKLDLPRGYESWGLAGADRSLSSDEQLARHDESKALVFLFTRDPSNDWGGYARDPELLNVVLLPPSAHTKAEVSLKRFSIERYYSPTDGTIPLDSPDWRTGGDARYRWRVLSMNDHFAADHRPRWAIAMLDAQRGIRLDLFVWQKRMKQEQALAMLRGLLDSMLVTSKLAEHFAQTGGVEARLARLRETNLQGVFTAIVPLGAIAPQAGQTTFGRGVAVWLDDDRKAVRVMRVLASVPLAGGATKASRDGQGRPRLPIVMKPEQYPGPTFEGLPSLNLQTLYWNPALERWQRSGLQRVTMHEAYPLLPFELAIVARLEQRPGARDAVHIVLEAHWFHPPALDDAREIGALLAECAQWETELLKGRIIGGDVNSSVL